MKTDHHISKALESKYFEEWYYHGRHRLTEAITGATVRACTCDEVVNMFYRGPVVVANRQGKTLMNPQSGPGGVGCLEGREGTPMALTSRIPSY